MQTLYEINQLNRQNTTREFTNRTATIVTGSHIMFRLRPTVMLTGASIIINMDVTFPDGHIKHFDMTVTEPGSYQRGGWAGEHGGGVISASGTVQFIGRSTIDAYIVVFEREEAIEEWV